MDRGHFEPWGIGDIGGAAVKNPDAFEKAIKKIEFYDSWGIAVVSICAFGSVRYAIEWIRR